MKTLVDDRLRAEARRYHLVFVCDDCAHFDASHARCVHGFPTEPHRRGLEHDSILFCKEFDAGP